MKEAVIRYTNNVNKIKTEAIFMPCFYNPSTIHNIKHSGNMIP